MDNFVWPESLETLRAREKQIIAACDVCRMRVNRQGYTRERATLLFFEYVESLMEERGWDVE